MKQCIFLLNVGKVAAIFFGKDQAQVYTFPDCFNDSTLALSGAFAQLSAGFAVAAFSNLSDNQKHR